MNKLLLILLIAGSNVVFASEPPIPTRNDLAEVIRRHGYRDESLCQMCISLIQCKATLEAATTTTDSEEFFDNSKLILSYYLSTYETCHKELGSKHVTLDK